MYAITQYPSQRIRMPCNAMCAAFLTERIYCALPSSYLSLFCAFMCVAFFSLSLLTIQFVHFMVDKFHKTDCSGWRWSLYRLDFFSRAHFQPYLAIFISLMSIFHSTSISLSLAHCYFIHTDEYSCDSVLEYIYACINVSVCLWRIDDFILNDASLSNWISNCCFVICKLKLMLYWLQFMGWFFCALQWW